MKKTVFNFITIMALLMPALVHAQEPGTVSGDTKGVRASLGISREMVKVIQAMPDSFKEFKGTFAMKDEDGNRLFQANDTDLGTVQQYVRVKQSGAVSFVATWKKKDKDDKTPVFAFAAFTGGILNVTDGMGYAISTPVTDSATSELTYYLKTLGVNGEIIAAFKFNPIFKESTFVVGKEQ